MYLVECKPDATLVKSLTGTSRKNIIHAGNKTELLKRLTKHFTNSIGIVDEDPWSHQSPLLNKFKKVQNLTKCDIKIFCRKVGITS
ncbi:MAG: hypothetical protein QXI91_05575 [Candidatus Bathyarchaeia archaeon]